MPTISPLFGAKGPPARRDGSPPPNLAKQQERKQLQEQRNQRNEDMVAADHRQQQLIQSILAAREEQEQQRQQRQLAAAAPIMMAADTRGPTQSMGEQTMMGAPPVGSYYGSAGLPSTVSQYERPMGMHPMGTTALPLPYAGSGYPNNNIAARSAGDVSANDFIAHAAASEIDGKKNGKQEWERLFWIGVACIIVFFLLLQTIFLAILLGRGERR